MVGPVVTVEEASAEGDEAEAGEGAEEEQREGLLREGGMEMQGGGVVGEGEGGTEVGVVVTADVADPASSTVGMCLRVLPPMPQQCEGV